MSLLPFLWFDHLFTANLLLAASLIQDLAFLD